MGEEGAAGRLLRPVESLENMVYMDGEFSDIPGSLECGEREKLIEGVENEEVEAVNEAYDDILRELGECRPVAKRML